MTDGNKSIAAVVVIGAGAGLAWWLLRKTVISPGDTILAKFTFDYDGAGGDYILQVKLLNATGPVLTATGPATLAAPQKYTKELRFELPANIDPGNYSAEALIRTSVMPDTEGLIKKFDENVIKVGV